MKKNVLDYYLDPILKDYLNFDGRATRKEFWMFTLFNFIVSIIISIVGGIIHFPMLSMIYSLAVFLPGLAISVRRLHDIGKSGWRILIVLIPLIGPLWLLVLFVLDSDGDNKYGKSLKSTINNKTEK